MAEALTRSLYKTDYYPWTKQQAAELPALAAARVNSTPDLENLDEEVESLGRSNLHAVWSQVQRMMEELVKLNIRQPSSPALASASPSSATASSGAGKCRPESTPPPPATPRGTP